MTRFITQPISAEDSDTPHALAASADNSTQPTLHNASYLMVDP